jgi:hypothetical protein
VEGRSLGRVVPTLVSSVPLDEAETTVGLPYTGSPGIGELGRRWLTDCLSLHMRCPSRSSTLTSFLPTRLVKVTASAGVVESARLVRGADVAMSTRYLTLSHCWGDLEFTTLTTETLQDFQSDTHQSKLTKTFRDALQVTVWLGYEYIWIDALCILQDSDEDWRAEIASMGSIYRNSTCTIAALGARDGNDGLFFHRSPPAMTPCPLFQDGSHRIYAADPRRYRKPLLERAWVLQEQCLSARTIQFGVNQVSWVCRTKECSELQRAVDPCDRSGRPLAVFTQLANSINQPSSFWSNVKEDWELLLDCYRERRLRSCKDRPYALQGVSSEIAKERGWHMAHGLWTHSWIEQLLWVVSCPKEIECTLEHGAPSWSWFNVNDHEYLEQGYREVKDADIALDPDSDRALCIKARMERLNILEATPRRPVETPRRDSYGAQLSVCGSTEWWPDTTENIECDVWGTQLTKIEQCKRVGSHKFVSCGLLVVPVDMERDIWRRVGSYRSEIHIKTTIDVPFPILLRPWFNGAEREIKLI